MMWMEGKCKKRRLNRAFLLWFGVVIICLAGETKADNEEKETAPLSREYKDESHKMGGNSSERYKILSFNYHHVEVPYVICLWILLASVAKIGFHLYDKLPHIFPESCLLITLGILVGVTLYFTETASSQQYSLDANIFFLFLLPPIIYDAGYHMPNRAFFNNMGTILLLAVVNTLWNTFGIGAGLWTMSYLGWIDQKISIFNCMIFSALISAVDPVAVLSIFEEIQVNEILYILVFGESLLNDGVTVVLYRMMEGFAAIGESNVQLVDFAAGFAQFFIVVIGGTAIGIIYGFIGAFITKYTDHVRIIEPLFIFVLGYLAYLTSEIMGLSSILALTFAGIIMRQYTEANMAKKSTTTVKYFMKMLATISETIIFMFLGLSTVIDSHDFHLDFIMFSILFCLVFRVTGVVLLSFIVNRRRLIRLTAIDQFIMSYGGLRGGIAFCLALLLNKHHVPEKAMFVTTTTVIVFFTVFIQGITIKPVVNALKVERAEEKDPSMSEMIHKRFIDHLMAGVEDIVGKSGHNSFQHKFEYYNNKYLKPLLLREKPKSRNASIVRTFTKLSMQDAKAAVLFSQGMSRDRSFSQILSCSPSTANLFRRATIAVPTARDRETVVNLTASGPMLTKSMGEDVTLRGILQDSLFDSRSTWMRGRSHTLAQIHTPSHLHQSDHQQLKHLFGNKPALPGEDKTNSGVYQNGSSITAPNVNGAKISKTVNFSDLHSPPSQMPVDGTENFFAQESSCHPEDTQPSQLVLTLGMPAPSVFPNQDDQSVAVEPQSEPTPSSPHASSRFKMSPHLAGLHRTTVCSSNSGDPATIPADLDRVPSCSSGDLTRTDPINIPAHCSRTTEDSYWGYRNSVFTDDRDASDNDRDTPGRAETLAESTLPWRRQTSLPPVPSSLSLSLPDDENPLMSEAPSWADNLAYSHLTETGSPYHSPQNTITAKPPVSHPRPVFDIFPPSSPHHSDSPVSSIPPPWSIKDSMTDHQDDEPLPSQSIAGRDSGDKASCFLVSSHDLVPPSYHSCIQPTNRALEVASSRRHSEVSSPTHFQFVDKPETISVAALESQLIGIEEDYHHGMKERVSRWLASSQHEDSELDEADYKLSTKEEGQRILESLRQKKETWHLHDIDDGTDADVESDDDIEDTRL